MIREIVKGMICNSTWIDPDSKVIYTFSDEQELCINGKQKLPYSISQKRSQVLLKMGEQQTYKVDYVNDFHLDIYNEETRFKLIPA